MFGDLDLDQMVGMFAEVDLQLSAPNPALRNLSFRALRYCYWARSGPLRLGLLNRGGTFASGSEKSLISLRSIMRNRLF